MRSLEKALIKLRKRTRSFGSSPAVGSSKIKIWETPTLTETVNYDYFCVTTQEIERTHSMDDNQLLPVCNAVQASLIRRRRA